MKNNQKEYDPEEELARIKYGMTVVIVPILCFVGWVLASGVLA